MLVNGDKLIVIKKVASFLDEGSIVKVVNVDDNGMISFAFGENFMHMGVMTTAECEKHFEKYVEKIAPTVTVEHIKEIIRNSYIKSYTVFDKCTVVTCQLPNGFVIVESSACVSPENYDEEMGMTICMEKIEDKIWELEGYRLQEELYRESNEKCDGNRCDGVDCDHCYCDECPEVIASMYNDACCDEEDECLDTDLDCDDCNDLGCPYNPKSM